MNTDELYPDLFALKPCGVCGDPMCLDWDPGDTDDEGGVDDAR